MRALLLIPAFFVFSACIKAYIPFVSEHNHYEIIQQGRAEYPELFHSSSETEKIGSPSVVIAINESSDISEESYSYSAKEITAHLSSSGFLLLNNGDAEITIKGNIRAVKDSDSGFGGFIDYKAQCDIAAINSATGRHIATFKTFIRGLGLTPQDASEAALSNAGREAAKIISREIISYYRSKSVVRLEVYNLKDLPALNSFYLSLKAIKGVSNAWLIDYRGGNAYFDVSCASGGAGNLARGLIETYGTDLKINRPSLMKLEAVIQKKDK